MEWTLAELVDRATRALADVRVANGRVTEVPDGRLIRWYATRGLVDRPLSGPGRSARYGPRHLLQLVAVKRLQAEGLRLVEIQHRLAGATDAILRGIAGPAAEVGPEADPVAGPEVRPEHGPAADRVTADYRFWTVPVAAVGHTTEAPDSVIAVDSVERVVRIGDVSVRLPFAGEPTRDDLAAITEAARPLLRVLTELARTELTRTEDPTRTAELTEGARG